MTSGDLHVAIPTNETWARKRKGWMMPNEQLYNELKRRCVGRILRADQGVDNKPYVEFALDS